MALDATIGGANANSYQDHTEADLYFADHLYASVWSAASSDNKDKALIMACRRMEQEEYTGQKVSFSQALKYPRYSPGNYSGFSYVDLNGNGYSSDSIPRPVKYAQCELALSILTSDVFAAAEFGSLKGLDLGPIKLDFGSGSLLSTAMPEQAMRYLRGLLITTARIVRA